MNSIILKHLIWLRGVTAALAVLGFLPEFTPLEKIDLLRALHATIIGWNSLLESIGVLLAEWFHIPKFPADSMNALVILVTVGLPALYASFTQDIDLWMRLNLNRTLVWVIAGMSSLLAGLLVYLVASDFVTGSVATRELQQDLVWIAAGMMAIIALRFLPTYRNGAASVLVFILTFEVLYVANTANLKERIDSFVCATTPEACPDQNPSASASP